MANLGWALQAVSALSAASYSGHKYPLVDIIYIVHTSTLCNSLQAQHLVHPVRVSRPVQPGQSMWWDDVGMDTTTWAYAVRREMNPFFAR